MWTDRKLLVVCVIVTDSHNTSSYYCYIISCSHVLIKCPPKVMVFVGVPLCSIPSVPLPGTNSIFCVKNGSYWHSSLPNPSTPGCFHWFVIRVLGSSNSSAPPNGIRKPDKDKDTTHILDGLYYPTDIITSGRVSNSLFPISNLNESHPYPLKAHRHACTPWPEDMVTLCLLSGKFQNHKNKGIFGRIELSHRSATTLKPPA